MRTQPQSTKCRVPGMSVLITLTVIILFSCSQKILAQQRDGIETSTESSSNSSAPSRRTVNYNIFAGLSMQNGEVLEMFGANASRGHLRGHPTIPGVELGSTTADPLMFITNNTERMRILSNGFIGIGTSNPITPFELHVPDANPYSVNLASASRMRLVNSNTTNNNAVELNLSTVDTSGVVSTGVRLIGIFTNHTVGAASAEMALVLRNGGAWSEVARFASGGNLGIGTNTPAYKLDVAGPIRSSSGGFVFPDGTVQTTAGGGGGGSSQWLTSGTNIFYNSGNVGVGTSTPGVALDVGQNRAMRVGNAILSSGGNFAHLANNAWYNGSAWQFTGGVGALYQINGQQHVFYTHNGAGAFTPQMFLPGNGSVGIGTTNPAHRLDVQGGTVNASGGLCIAGDCKTAWSQVGGGTNSQWTTSGTSIFYNNGNVGIGSSNPLAKLHVAGVAPLGTAVFSGSAISSHFNYNGDNSEDTYIRGGKSTSRVIVNDGAAGNVLLAQGGGFVGVGTGSPTEKLEVNGNIKVSGNINAKYQDVAEWVESSQEIVAGTVVILDASRSNHVVTSTYSYDSRVAGVISRQPGLTLGEAGEGRVLVATTGRVKVKVDATNGPIQIGDLLVTSDREGFAMKSLPVNLGGVRMHRPGTLIGKALEPLATGTGEVLVLLSLQ